LSLFPLKKGFELIRLPEKTFEWLKAWYDAEKAKEIFEGPVGPCMNQHTGTEPDPTVLSFLVSAILQAV